MCLALPEAGAVPGAPAPAAPVAQVGAVARGLGANAAFVPRNELQHGEGAGGRQGAGGAAAGARQRGRGAHRTDHGAQQEGGGHETGLLSAPANGSLTSSAASVRHTMTLGLG